jgi:hypothetical protein
MNNSSLLENLKDVTLPLTQEAVITAKNTEHLDLDKIASILQYESLVFLSAVVSKKSLNKVNWATEMNEDGQSLTIKFGFGGGM